MVGKPYLTDYGRVACDLGTIANRADSIIPALSQRVGVDLWAQAVEAAGTTDAPGIRQALRNQRFYAPGGPVRIDSENQHTWKTMRLGRIVEGGQFEIVWSSEKPIRPEPYPTSRSVAAWDEFLAELFEEWDGHWTKPPH